MARGYALNVEAVKEALNARTVTATDVSRSFGLSDNWLNTMLSVGRASKENAEKLERALFAKPGAFIVNEPKEEPKEAAKKEQPTEESREIIKLLQELVKNTAVIRAQGEEIIGRLNTMAKDATAQRAVGITKLTEIQTQIFKTRSAIERAQEGGTK